MNLAPIALFAYNRPRHTQQTVDALQRNELAPESDLFVFCDAPRTPSAIGAVRDVRDYVRTISGFKSVEIIERAANLGLANSIIDGVTRLCDARGKIIALEDDMITSPYFLRFMNEALDLYEHDENVISIHGYWFPTTGELPETFFLKGADCGGWATWKRGWDLFEPDGRVLLQELETRKLTYPFDLEGAYPFTRMLKKQGAGKIDSWAIRWRASAYLHNKLTLYPGRSLILNIGFDGTGVHCSPTDQFSGTVSDSPIGLERIPVEEHAGARQKLIAFHRSTRPHIATRALRKLRKLWLTA